MVALKYTGVNMKFQDLIATLSQLHRELQDQAIRAVNTSLTLRNWCFGFYIVEFEQDGHDRAQYGTKLLTCIAEAIATHHIPNTNERELRRYRQFYLTYPQLSQVISNNLIWGTVSPESRLLTPRREVVSPELKLPQSHILNLCHRLSYSHFVELI